ncbi:MAG: hypothetical protein JRF63_03070 [Deltaproteobacteria bacterium]|nr:hypothetical protein [Deltaproteobacteria bacterium]
MRTTAVSLVVLVSIVWSGVARAQDEPELSADPAGPELEVDTDLPVGPLLLGSLGLALVAVGAGFGWQAKQEHESWEEARDTGDPLGQMDELADDVKAHSITANVLMFSGVGLTALSVILLLVGGDDEEGDAEGDTALLSPQFGPGQAGLIVQF